MKKSLFSGLILLLPITITLVILIFIIDLLTNPFVSHVQHFLLFFGASWEVDLSQHQTLLLLVSRLIILLLIFTGIILLGFLANKLFFHWMMKLFHKIVLKIPFINTIYKVCRDIIETIFSGKKTFFSRVVLTPFPSDESHTLGLVTGNAPEVIQKVATTQNPVPSEVVKTIFVPTSPHPISGFLFFIKNKHLQSLDLTIEESFKFLISCGIYTPSNDSPPPSNSPKTS